MKSFANSGDKLVNLLLFLFVSASLLYCSPPQETGTNPKGSEKSPNFIIIFANDMGCGDPREIMEVAKQHNAKMVKGPDMLKDRG